MKGGFLILKLVRKMVKKILMTSSIKYDYHPSLDHDVEDDEEILADFLPEDVKEGHFAVQTVDDGEMRRFVIELSYLAHPGFLKLLELAEEEFGFGQIGVLAIPCTYSDLQSIVGSKEKH